MEVDEIHCKFPRLSNGDGKLAHGHKMDDGEEEDGENKRGIAGVASASAAALRGRAVDLGGGLGRFYGWPSSRIVRVSRASGGKDRHSKVLTSKGLRDRRVRLSVNTAIQFYDLQDRLGYDQPSKAVEWLLKAAAASIDELPPMNSPFPDTPKQLSDEKRSSTAGSDQFGFDSAEVDGGGGAGDPNFSHPQVTKSSAACSSTSETSKGSGLSLSRSESRIKARERAKGRVAEKEKEKENESSHVGGSMNHISQTTSFTELLSGGMNNGGNNNGAGGDGNNTNESNFFLKSSPRHWSSTPMDYFTSGLLGQTSARSGQMHMAGGNPFTSPLFSVSTDHHHHHPELQQFSFVSDMSNNQNHDHHHNGGGGDYNLNFSISSSSANSSGLAGYNRGTLQSNSSPPQSSSQSMLPHHHHHHHQLQRFNSDGSPQGFYIGTAAPVENHHQFQSGYDARLQLCYGDSQSAGQKGKGKN